jgi:hypothetical protein
MPSEQPAELWGTFAVDDHLRPRAFVAEAILFDRLVIPMPPRGNEAAYAEWLQSGWQPGRLLEIRKRLGPQAIPVPWNDELRKRWREEYSPAVRRGPRQAELGGEVVSEVRAINNMPEGTDPKLLTRQVLANKLNDVLDDDADRELVREIRALDIDPAATPEVVVGYGSLANYQADLPAESAVGNQQTPPPGDGNPTLFVTWDFLVPEDSSLPDEDLLIKAVALNSKEEFRDSRRQFHEWRRKLAEKGVSVDQARSEMSRCLAVYNGIVAKERRRTRRLTALQAVAAAAPLADFIHMGVGVVAGAALGGASLLAERWYPHCRVSARNSVAALIHDSREAFGWRPRL